MTRRRRGGMRPADLCWLCLWLALAFGVRWYYTGLPPWPTAAG